MFIHFQYIIMVLSRQRSKNIVVQINDSEQAVIKNVLTQWNTFLCFERQFDYLYYIYICDFAYIFHDVYR